MSKFGFKINKLGFKINEFGFKIAKPRSELLTQVNTV